MKQGQQTISTIEEYILTVLDGRELYGLEIINALKIGSGGKLQLSCGTLYPTLRRLEMKGLVSARWGDESGEERRGVPCERRLEDGRSVAQLHKRGQQVRLIGLKFLVYLSWYDFKRSDGKERKTR